ncbi:hypothetical protein BT63DRAFT_463287 [Microthyrium microscopicum]|uniref:Heterokaryon incompatibility domain-containing protein n=1 Tax=Microthyrium microscopicum TaxID=703497 RepID=A0A6A6U4D1_9PEZI|nr:hypothetical protein BT63DRAFT_463287 [Microthyrium microscopicum]
MLNITLLKISRDYICMVSMRPCQSISSSVLTGTVDHAQEYRNLVRNSPLLQRGWIFQEWFLSRRILYFTTAGLFFECQDSYPVSEAHIEFPHSTSTKLDPFFKAGIRKFTGSPELLWYTLVELYSELDLTQANKDRIIAMAGVAKEVRSIFSINDKKYHAEPQHYEYIAGLWLRDIHQGLLWQRKNIEGSYKPLAGYPSWSWASTLNAVCWDQKPPHSKPEMQITHLIAGDNTEVKIQSPCNNCNAFDESTNSHPGQLLFPYALNNSFTRLRVEGRMTNVWIRETLDEKQRNFLRKVTKSNAQELWTTEDDKTERGYAWFQLCSIAEPSIIAGWAVLDNLEMIRFDPTTKDYRLRLVALHVSTRTGILGGIVYGQLGNLGHTHNAFDILLLEKTENTSQDEYKRVGMGCVFDMTIIREFQKELDVQFELI